MAPAQRVVLIVIDGLRPDAIEQAETPALHRLMSAGAYSLAAQSVSPEVSLPCHVSMFFSLEPREHGVLDNTFRPLPEGAVSLLEQVKDARRGTSAVYSWEPLRDLARPDALDFSYYHRHSDPLADGRELEMAAVAADTLVRDEPGFTLLYIELTDLVGHFYGWMSAEYLEAVTRADRAVELLLDEVEGAGLLESTALLVLADHGGHEHNHGTLQAGDEFWAEDATIPFILAGAGVRRGVVLEEAVSLLDVAPTLAYLLGVPLAAGWRGRVLLEALEP